MNGVHDANSTGADATPTVRSLLSAGAGFDNLFANRLAEAREQLAKEDSPFHLLGLGVCSFLEAALGMESVMMAEAGRSLAHAAAVAKKHVKATKASPPRKGNFPVGIEWEIVLADTTILLGMTHALSESYMGYLQCLYALNSAHSKFTKLYKTIFPHGLDSYATPSQTPVHTPLPGPSRNPSTPSLATVDTITPSITAQSPSRSFFSRWTSSSPTESLPTAAVQPEGPVEELIVSGAAFGFGLFNLVLSLLPQKVKTVVGFLGFQHNRQVALQALAVSAAQTDVHSVFAGLALMTYYGVVLLLAGYQADEAHIVRQYRAIVDGVSTRYPDGSLWILNRAKILRMTYDPDSAITVLQDGLRPDRPGYFRQADALLVFELAWTLLSQRRYQEAADMFMRMTELNTWSHATYYAIIAGCYVPLGNKQKAKELFDKIPDFLDKRTFGGKELPTEVLVKKRLDFYKKKAKRRGGEESDYVDCMKINFAEEMAIFWNTHERITRETAIAHINELCSFTPPVEILSPYITHPIANQESGFDDLDTPDELAIRSLVLGLVHRTLGEYAVAREFLKDAYRLHAQAESNWIGGVALFEEAVLDLKEAEANDLRPEQKSRSGHPNGSVNGEKANKKSPGWVEVLNRANEMLDKAMSISGSNVDLSSRLDTRVNMLRDEIALKKQMLGVGLS